MISIGGSRLLLPLAAFLVLTALVPGKMSEPINSVKECMDNFKEIRYRNRIDVHFCKPSDTSVKLYPKDVQLFANGPFQMTDGFKIADGIADKNRRDLCPVIYSNIALWKNKLWSEAIGIEPKCSGFMKRLLDEIEIIFHRRYGRISGGYEQLLQDGSGGDPAGYTIFDEKLYIYCDLMNFSDQGEFFERLKEQELEGEERIEDLKELYYGPYKKLDKLIGDVALARSQMDPKVYENIVRFFMKMFPTVSEVHNIRLPFTRLSIEDVHGMIERKEDMDRFSETLINNLKLRYGKRWDTGNKPKQEFLLTNCKPFVESFSQVFNGDFARKNEILLKYEIDRTTELRKKVKGLMRVWGSYVFCYFLINSN